MSYCSHQYYVTFHHHVDRVGVMFYSGSYSREVGAIHAEGSVRWVYVQSDPDVYFKYARRVYLTPELEAVKAEVERDVLAEGEHK